MKCNSVKIAEIPQAGWFLQPAGIGLSTVEFRMVIVYVKYVTPTLLRLNFYLPYT